MSTAQAQADYDRASGNELIFNTGPEKANNLTHIWRNTHLWVGALKSGYALVCRVRKHQDTRLWVVYMVGHPQRETCVSMTSKYFAVYVIEFCIPFSF